MPFTYMPSLLRVPNDLDVVNLDSDLTIAIDRKVQVGLRLLIIAELFERMVAAIR